MKFLAALVVLLPVAALAQSAPTPKEQALGSRILFELNANVECNTNLITVREELARARAELEAATKRLKELEKKE